MKPYRKGNSDPSAPCRNCPDRSVGCHATCKDYLDFAEDRKVFLERSRNAAKEPRYYDNYYLGFMYTRKKKI